MYVINILIIIRQNNYTLSKFRLNITSSNKIHLQIFAKLKFFVFDWGDLVRIFASPNI